MKLGTLKYLLNDTSHLFEANILNAGKDEIIINDSDGNEVENIHTFDKILSKYLKSSIFNNRTTEEIKQWFEANFYNWIKRGATDHADDMMDEKKFQKIFYVPLSSYIENLLDDEPALVKSGKLSSDIILKSFPEWVQNNPGDAVVFSGGRLFRLNKITEILEKVHEFLLANEQAGGSENVVCPLALQAKKITQLQFPEAVKRTIAWHRYTEQQAEKVDKAKAVQLVKELKPGTDYEVIDDTFDDILVVKLKSAKAADVEGAVLKHCIASYGRDIENGKTIIHSIRDKEMLPLATIEMTGKNSANQVKGPHNGPIKPEFHDSVRNYFTNHKISVGNDAKNFGGMKEK